MQDSLFSSQWYRVAKLRPRVRSNVVTHRHYYRRAVWYIVGAKSNKTHLRINASAFFLFTQFDGERTVDSVWQSALAVLNDDAPSQGEVIELLGLLFESAMVDFQRETDVDRLFESHRRKQSQDAKSRYWNPLFLRFSVFNPDRLAGRLLPWFKWAFTRAAFNLWLSLMLMSVVAATYAWGDIARELSSGLVSPGNLVILWVVFPVMKLLHELGHAVAVKRWGGEVNELGIALLVLVPVPFVDASDSASFSGKYRRMAVAGAGVVVETTLASLGLFVWLLVEPGLVRDVAFNVLLTGSVSSLLFNGNPLLKFDGYYVFSDFLEIPNLATRSSRYLLYLIKRYGFGVQEKSPVTADGEKAWFAAYGLLATAYRLSLTTGICLFVASHYFFVGVCLAIWALIMQIGLPIWRAGKFLVADSHLQQSRLRANLVAAAFAVAAIGLLFYVPVPNTTQVRGVVWPVDEAMVRTAADCFVEQVLVPNGTEVDAGTELVRCDSSLLEAEVDNLRAEQLAARAALYSTRDRVERSVKQGELDTATELLANAEAKLAKSTLTGSTHGVFFAPESTNLAGSYFAQGKLVGYVLNESNLSIRTMLQQDRVALLGDNLGDVEVRLLRAPERVLPSTVLRKVPAATDHLVTPALGAKGGGELALSPEDTDGSNLNQPAFEVELQLPDEFRDSLVGEAVAVQFDHGSASVAELAYRQLRLLLLRRLNV